MRTNDSGSDQKSRTFYIGLWFMRIGKKQGAPKERCTFRRESVVHPLPLPYQRLHPEGQVKNLGASHRSDIYIAHNYTSIQIASRTFPSWDGTTKPVYLKKV